VIENIRCLVWDLDNTLWSGTLLEADRCRLRPGVRSILSELDRRGILLSIASANDTQLARAQLERKGLDRLFLHPQICWNNKVHSIQTIAEKLDVALRTIGFIDDEPFEREQVHHVLPEVRTYAASSYRSFLDRPEFCPAVLSDETSTRREKYQQAVARVEAETKSGMSRTEFLEHCQVRLEVRPASPNDLPRILELMQRTNQLNSTGVVHEPQQLTAWLDTPTHRVYVATLAHRFVDYGRIGVAICRCEDRTWELLGFLLSCRVLSRGISGYFLAGIVGEAHKTGASRFRCRYRPTGRNHRMETLYRLAGFRPVGKPRSGSVVYQRATRETPAPPRWLNVNGEGKP